MKRWGIVSIVLFSLLGFWRGPAFAEDKTPVQLEAEYGRESNPKKRVKLAIRLTDERLKQLLAAYETRDSGKAEEAVENYLTGVDRLEKAIREASNSGASKDAEIHLRRQVRALENLRMGLSPLEAAPVEKASARVTKLREEILYSIMKPHK